MEEWSGVECCEAVLLGGLLASEDAMGFQQLRLKKHRWHRKILKNQAGGHISHISRISR